MCLRLKPHPIIHRARLKHLLLSVLLFTIVACECPRHFSVVLFKIALGELLSAYSLPVFVQICIVPSFFSLLLLLFAQPPFFPWVQIPFALLLHLLLLRPDLLFSFSIVPALSCESRLPNSLPFSALCSSLLSTE
jgi:hypothetical protein